MQPPYFRALLVTLLLASLSAAVYASSQERLRDHLHAINHYLLVCAGRQLMY